MGIIRTAIKLSVLSISQFQLSSAARALSSLYGYYFFFKSLLNGLNMSVLNFCSIEIHFTYFIKNQTNIFFWDYLLGIHALKTLQASVVLNQIFFELKSRIPSFIDTLPQTAQLWPSAPLAIVKGQEGYPL